MKPSIYSLTRQDMIDWAEENGEKKFRAAQIWEWLYRKRVQSFEEMTNLSKDLIAIRRQPTQATDRARVSRWNG